uniref:Uncharacterized protein n=1 Tax=Arundo donax TaxID=35708 RepID=A0A0A9GI58_ARUDO
MSPHTLQVWTWVLLLLWYACLPTSYKIGMHERLLNFPFENRRFL